MNAEAPEVELPCDVVIAAIGQAIDFGNFVECGIPERLGKFQTESSGAVAGKDGIYAGGDCASGPTTVIMAIQAGKIAAANLDEYFGFHSEIAEDIDIPQVDFHFVEVAGSKTLAASCTTPVEEGMEVYTASQRVLEARVTNLSLILSEHNTNCTFCERSGNCTLQTLAQPFDLRGVPYEQTPDKKDWDPKYPLIRDSSRCIKCMRCVAVCEKVQTMRVWDVSGTGAGVIFGTTGGAGGGGQPIRDSQELGEARGKILRELDREKPIRFSHENASVQKLYEKYMEKPLSHRAHKLLHTDIAAWKL